MQLDIFKDAKFDGKTYEPKRDQKRLAGQLGRVYDLMLDGKWRTLSEIAHATGSPEGSISARLRDLRKERFGYHTVNRRERLFDGGSGLFEYQLILKEEN